MIRNQSAHLYYYSRLYEEIMAELEFLINFNKWDFSS